jgi:hypothetical protein
MGSKMCRPRIADVFTDGVVNSNVSNQNVSNLGPIESSEVPIVLVDFNASLTRFRELLLAKESLIAQQAEIHAIVDSRNELELGPKKKNEWHAALDKWFESAIAVCEKMCVEQEHAMNSETESETVGGPVSGPVSGPNTFLTKLESEWRAYVNLMQPMVDKFNTMQASALLCLVFELDSPTCAEDFSFMFIDAKHRLRDLSTKHAVLQEEVRNLVSELRLFSHPDHWEKMVVPLTEETRRLRDFLFERRVRLMTPQTEQLFNEEDNKFQNALQELWNTRKHSFRTLISEARKWCALESARSLSAVHFLLIEKHSYNDAVAHFETCTQKLRHIGRQIALHPARKPIRVEWSFDTFRGTQLFFALVACPLIQLHNLNASSKKSNPISKRPNHYATFDAIAMG